MSAVTPAGASALSPDAPLSIAYLTYRGKPHVGGQGVYTRHLTKALVDLGHNVEVFGGQPYPILDERVGATDAAVLSDDELDQLDKAPGIETTSRLGCQIMMSDELDGIKVTLPAATRNLSVDKK